MGHLEILLSRCSSILSSQILLLIFTSDLQQFQAAAATSALNKTKPNQVEEDEAKEAHLTSSVAISGANNGKDPSILAGLASRRHYYYWPHKQQQ
jgi:hypothetical protein